MTQPFSAEDLYLHQKLTELHCIAGLDTAVATVRSVDREQDQYAIFRRGA